jgi:hypothetical protein
MNECTIVSFMPIRLYEQKSGVIPPAYLIPAAEGETPGTLIIGPATYFTYIDQDRGSLRSTILAEHLAKGICDDFIQSQFGIEDDAAPGLCWFSGRHGNREVMERFPKEISEIVRKHRNWYRAICSVADNDWARYHNHNAISDIQRMAGRSLGLDPERHEWISIASSAETITCPACKTSVRSDAVVCSTCRCILNLDKYKLYIFAKGE